MRHFVLAGPQPRRQQNFLRVSQSPSRPMAKDVMPKPIIQRKPQ